MLIKYDRIVLEQARRIASSPTALQRDLMRYLHDEDVLGWFENGGPVVSYLAPEVRSEVMSLVKSLPRNAKSNKFKKRSNNL